MAIKSDGNRPAYLPGDDLEGIKHTCSHALFERWRLLLLGVEEPIDHGRGTV